MRNICTVDGCDKVVHGRGYCKIHHQRLSRTGDPLKVRKFLNDPVAAFWSRTDKNGPIHPVHGQCWVWTGGKAGMMGYGRLVIPGKGGTGAHRFSWTIHNGEVTDGLFVLHRCDLPHCVNPAHLFLGTHDDNMKDKKDKGRAFALEGDDNPCSVLTTEQVVSIKAEYRGKSKTHGAIALATKYGVSRYTISAIISGRNWKHV